MTDRSKQHCGHECDGEVCYSYRDYQSDDLDPCLAVKCQHDTRTHSAAPDIRMSEAMGNLVRVACEQAKREERERVLGNLKKDLKTRFIPQTNQWSKGRNSGLLECCNIIDETLRGEQR